MAFTEQQLAALRGKIESEAAFKDANLDLIGISSGRYSAHRVIDTEGNYVYSCPWWLEREYHRLDAGVYSTTTTLENIAHGYLCAHALHIATEADDPTMVAYTPSAEEGMRDKQIRTTLGRYLKKHCITLTDKQIQKLEQEHKAELATAFLTAETVDDIMYIYQNMEGDTGCMRRDGSYYNMQSTMHPSMVYAAPGIKVAYTKTEDGRIMSRSVIYENPADPTDKRYVRTYGHPVLRKILERNGYVCKDLLGAKLAKVEWRNTSGATSTGDNAYVMPYLDGAGGSQGSGSGIGSYVADYGDGYLTVIDERMAMKISAVASSAVASAKSTGGRIRVTPCPSSEFVCGLTGERYDRFTMTTDIVKALKDGKIVDAAESSVTSLKRMRMFASTNSGVLHVYVPADTPSFMHRGYTYADDAMTRRGCGMVRLSTKYYPDSTDWSTSSFTTTIQVDGVDHVVRDEDTFYLFDATGADPRRVHKADYTDTRKQGLVRCATYGDSNAMISKARMTYAKTVGGTAFDTVFHADRFVKTFDGEWVTKGQSNSFRMFNSTFYYRVGTDRFKLPLGIAAQAFRDTARGADITSIMAGLDVSGMDSATAITVREMITGKALTAYRAASGYRFWLDNDGNLKVGSDASSWQQCLDTLKTCREFDFSGNYYEEQAKHVAILIEAIGTVIDPYLLTLDALIEQKKLEEAGQMRIDAAIMAEDAAQVEENQAVVVSDERFAVAA